MAPFRDRPSWYLGLSAYWFAASFKWFILLLAILPEQVRSLVPEGEQNTQWGLVFAIGSVWAIIGPSIFGYLSDRLGPKIGKRRPFIALGAGLTVVALIFLASADSMWMLVVGYLLLQVSDDVGTGPYSALIPELVPEERRGRASGFMGMLQLAGQLASGVTGLALGADFRAVYGAIAVVNIVCAAWAILTIRGAAPVREPESKPGRPSIVGFLWGWLAPWRSPDFRWVWFTRFLVSLGYYMIQPYLSNFLKDRVRDYSLFGLSLGDDPEKTTMAAAALGLTIALFGALGAATSIRLTDRWGRKRVVQSSGIVMLAALLPFPWILNYSSLWCLSVVFGVGYGAYLSADWALASDVLPIKGDEGKDMGVWQMSVSSVQLAAGMFGRVIDALNRLGPGWGYTAVFMGAGVFFLLGTSLVTRIRGST